VLRMSGSVRYLTARTNIGKGRVIPRQFYEDDSARERFWAIVDHFNRLEYVTARTYSLNLVSVNEEVQEEWGRFLFNFTGGHSACYYKVEERSWQTQCGIRRRRGRGRAGWGDVSFHYLPV